MYRRLQGSLFGLERLLTALGSGFVDTFLRDNKMIPVLLALLVLFIFCWVMAAPFSADPTRAASPTGPR
jgi:hypothetical protein